MVSMKKQYRVEFKIRAVKKLKKTGELLSNVARELDVIPTAMHDLVQKYKESPEVPFLICSS
ncbi:transposase [Clostridium beijerinckii]|uniref:transposase n=1 Tax=Clostridium beijerinckii TaxID=1520 RepID=UPI00149481D5|nr:transposase [Clostridium beijerinckii]NOW06730.1 transposase-like protein [Clostridium beijerinckii]NYC00127.1 transposase-like protein [Clostridium beijerinckii]